MPPSSIPSVKSLKQIFTKKGSKIVALVNKKKEDCIVDRVPGVKEKIKWVCAKCGVHRITTLGNILSRKKEKLTCPSCGISTLSFEETVTSLEKDGWEVLTSKEEYLKKKSRTKLEVICSNGHQTKMTRNHWIGGHRCARCVFDKKLVGIERARKEFKEKGFTLLSTEYVNNSTPLRCICKCGREHFMALNNLQRNIDGCRECTKRWTWDDAFDFVEDQGCCLISDRTEFVLNKDQITYICLCGEANTACWRSFKEGKRCAKCGLKKREATCLKTYNETNPAKAEVCKEKSRQTNLKKRGVDHHMKDPDCKKQMQTTYIERYKALGFAGIIGEQMRETNRKKYGHDYPLQCPKIREKCEETTFERYNVRFPLQNPQILQKALLKAYSTKDYTFPSGRIEKVQGYEPFALDLLIKWGVEEEDIVVGCTEVPTISYTYEGVDRKYHPDIYLRSRNILIEVKSAYTYLAQEEKNVAKFQAAAVAGYVFLLCVFDHKKELVDTVEFRNTQLIFPD